MHESVLLVQLVLDPCRHVIGVSARDGYSPFLVEGI